LAGLNGYFEGAALFAPGLGLAGRVGGILSALDLGRPVIAPPDKRPGQRW
jgi:hypothetical protein